MKLFTSVATILAFFIFNAMQVNIHADNNDYEDEPIYPNQEHRLCDSRHCENTCAEPDAENNPCPFRLCHEGYFCSSGYVRESETESCILPSDCPAEEVDSDERPDAVFRMIPEHKILNDYLL